MDADYEKNLTTPSPTGPQFKPMKGYLIVVGFFVTLIGILFCGLGWLYAFKLPAIMALEAEDLGSFAEIGKSILFGVGLGLGAVGLGVMILGIGSMALRRWARDLLFATGWLLIGFAGLIAIALVSGIPNMLNMRTAMLGGPGGGIGKQESMLIMAMYAVTFIIYVLIVAAPGVLLVLIYRSKNVELTTRYFDQSSSWTEKCHVTVLVLWLFFIVSAILLATMLFGYSSAMVQLGILTSETVGNLIFAASAVILCILAFGVSKSAPWAWWGSLGYLIVAGCATVWFFTTVDFESIIREMIGEEIDEDPEMNQFFSSYIRSYVKSTYLTGLVSVLSLIGYLFVIKKHFFGQKELVESGGARA